MKIKIHCFEGEWDRDHPELSVRPLLDVLEQSYISAGKHLTHSYKFCQSTKRLSENLKIDGRSLSKSVYRHCFYFAFHGDSKGLWSFDGDESISFENIATSFGQKAAGSIVFFGSCGTRTTQAELEKFKAKTNAELVVGYGSSVDWLQASMFEMLFFSELCRFQQIKRFENRMRKVSSEGLFSKLKVQLI